MQQRRTNAERHAQTRAALLSAAREIFAGAGFADAATEAIVRQAAVTRGALYYHFRDKAGLFEAVFEETAGEIVAVVSAEAEGEPTAFEGLAAGCRAYVDACLGPDIRQIYLIDGPAVLGWTRWREIDARHSVGSLREGITAVLDEAPQPPLSAEVLTVLVSGALNEAVLWLAEAEPSPTAHDNLYRGIRTLLERLFAPQ